MKDVLIISYSIGGGVAGLRSKALINFLNKKGVNVKAIACNSKLLNWYIKIFLSIVFGKEKIVYFSCGPFIYSIFFIILAKILLKEVIVDFRDPWSLNILHNYGKLGDINKLKYTIVIFLEKIIYFFTNKFIVCTEGMYLEYSKIFKSNNKMVLILNGYSFDFIYTTKKDKKNEEIIKFVCIGKFAEYSQIKAENILNNIKDKMKIPFSIDFIGSDYDSNAKILEKCGILNKATFHEKKPYEDVINFTASCDVGLLILRNENIEYGTKIFDYIGLKKPFYSILNKDALFFKEFNEFLFDFEHKGLIGDDLNEKILMYSREAQFLKLEGILY